MKYFLLFLMAISIQSNAYTLKTISQEGADAKFDPSSKEKPGLCREIADLIHNTNPNISFEGFDNIAQLKRIEHLLENGEIDSFVCLLKNEEREKKFDFINIPLYEIKHVVLTSANEATAISNIEDLKKVSEQSAILVPTGSSLIKFLESKQIKIDSSGKDEESNILKLINGRGKFVYGQDVSLNATITKKKIEFSKLKYLPTTFKEEAQYIAVSKKLSAEAKQEITKVIEKLKSDGKLEELYKKYKP